jgi:ACS family tartrate transporter-like MFS transporter
VTTQPHALPVTASLDQVASVAERARYRIARRLVPFLFILYVFNYIDRVNISFASLQMTKELAFSNGVFGFGAGIFFIGYFLLQVPTTMLIEWWSAKKFVGVSLIVWGGLAALTGLIRSAQQFYVIRFFLGIAEAGFFPGVIVYLTHWYRNQDRAKAVALFMIAIPTSNMLGAALASVLMQISWLGYSGWRWLLILEGVPSIVLGLVAFFYLTDRPEEAEWLADDERQWIVSELAKERAAKQGQAKVSGWQAMRHPAVWLLSLAYFCYITNSTGLGTWLPKIVQRISGLSTTQVILLSGIPWLAAIPAMIVSAWHSDRSGERRWHAAIPIVVAGVALYLSVQAGTNLVLALAAFSVATIALYSFPSPFWALPPVFLSGPTAAATIALINSSGNLGGFLGPYAIGWLTDRTGGYTAGLYYLMIATVVAGVSVVLLRRDDARA